MYAQCQNNNRNTNYFQYHAALSMTKIDKQTSLYILNRTCDSSTTRLQSTLCITTLVHPIPRPPPGLEIGLTPRHDTITFVISDDGGSELAPPCCGGVGPPGRARGSGGRLADSLPVYDLQVTVFPVDSQAPSLVAGTP